MLIPDALFCLSSSLIACWSLWSILLCQTCMHSALYFTLCPSVTFSNFCETFSSNSPLCSVASAIVSPFFMILHNFPFKWTSRPFSTSFFTEIRFPHGHVISPIMFCALEKNIANSCGRHLLSIYHKNVSFMFEIDRFEQILVVTHV